MRFAVIAVVLLAIGACFLIACSGSPSTKLQTQPPPGPVVATQVACPSGGLPATSCYSLDITCPNVDVPSYTAYVKIIAPARPIGTIIFTTGGTGTTLYEFGTNGVDGYAATVVSTVFSAGYEAVQLTFGAPFSSGPGWQYDANGQGVRAAACRYAMVVQWLAQQTPSVPLCATGNSAGGALIGEGLAHYGLGSYLTFAEITSGPPFSRVDLACSPTTVGVQAEPCSHANVGPSVGISDATNYIDPAYPGPWCSQSIQPPGSTQYQQQFQNDSITLPASPDAVLNYPSTTIKFLFGELDTSSAPLQGMEYQSQITSSQLAPGCVSGAPHDIPSFLPGAQTIATDLTTNCHK